VQYDHINTMQLQGKIKHYCTNSRDALTNNGGITDSLHTELLLGLNSLPHRRRCQSLLFEQGRKNARQQKHLLLV